MHLISFLINSPINHTILSWSDPADERLEMLGSLARWQQLAKTYERGLFDGIFFADTPGVFDRYKERSDEAVRYGVCWPPHDPVVLLSALAAATERLGLAVTLSISANHPYQAVRSLSTSTRRRAPSLNQTSRRYGLSTRTPTTVSGLLTIRLGKRLHSTKLMMSTPFKKISA